MFLTCNSSSSEQLQRPQPSVLICQFRLGVGINREVDGGEGDVTQEARFGSLTEKKKRSIKISQSWAEAVVEEVCLGD